MPRFRVSFSGLGFGVVCFSSGHVLYLDGAFENYFVGTAVVLESIVSMALTPSLTNDVT